MVPAKNRFNSIVSHRYDTRTAVTFVLITKC